MTSRLEKQPHHFYRLQEPVDLLALGRPCPAIVKGRHLPSETLCETVTKKRRYERGRLGGRERRVSKFGSEGETYLLDRGNSREIGRRLEEGNHGSEFDRKELGSVLGDLRWTLSWGDQHKISLRRGLGVEMKSRRGISIELTLLKRCAMSRQARTALSNPSSSSCLRTTIEDSSDEEEKSEGEGKEAACSDGLKMKKGSIVGLMGLVVESGVGTEKDSSSCCRSRLRRSRMIYN
jgi:hypothetical protein